MGANPEATGSGARERGHPLRAGIAALALLGLSLAACGSSGAASGASGAPRATPAPAPTPIAMVAALQAQPIADRPAPLTPLFRALERLGQHEGGPVRILQLGDSHTAGDYFTGELRALFQQRFGNAGRGSMVAGLPFRGIRQVELRVTQTGRWTYRNSFTHPEDGPYGIAAFTAESRGAGASLSLDALDPEGFDRVEIELLRQSKGGVLDIEVDERRLRRVATEGTQHLLRVALAVPAGSRSLRLRAADRRPVRILSWSVERRARGVVVEGFGVSGAAIGLVSKWSPEIVTDELRHLSPALVILAYGTNEGFLDDFDAEKYRQTAAAALDFLRRALPGTSILVLGPPDGQHLVPQSCYSRHGVGAEASCARDASAARGGACTWVTPAPLATVREIQRQESMRVGAAFWDWAAVMGGECAMHQWGLLDPPLGRADHIHMTAAGYAESADALFREIMAAYDGYLASEPRRPRPRGTRP